MKRQIAILVALAAALTSAAFAGEDHDAKDRDFPRLDHVFLIMMENHGYSQIINNPNAPFTNQWAKSANLATNYFAVAHPSLTNYLEVVGGSNFGVLNDHAPDWGNTSCSPNIVASTISLDTSAFPNICPIWGTGTDAATPVLDPLNEGAAQAPVVEIDGVKSIPASNNIAGKTIADQLVDKGRSWKSYQESLPLGSIYGVNYSDGFFTNLTDFTKVNPQLAPALTHSNIVNLYAVKHDPFAYFRNVQEGQDPHNSLENVVGFDALYADLGSGHVPSFSFIVPNQCDDQHGQGNAGPFCNYDPNDDGSQAGLNPALIYQGDVTLQRLVTAIKKSPVWGDGNNAIVVVWDENDYSAVPNTNQVVLIVDTNRGPHGVQSNQFYTHFSLLKSMEAGLGLPCLNHACDAGSKVMSDLFGSN
jgi:phosphatidylinositol-3-phosphatase